MATRVVINQAALAAWINTNAAAQAGLAATAKSYEEAVVQAAPVGTSLSYPWRRPMRHGLFKKSIKVRKFRHYFRVVSDDEFALMIEYGSQNNPPYAPFRRMLRRFGGIELRREQGEE